MSKLGKERYKCHFLNCFKLENDKRGIVSSSSKAKREKNVREGECYTGSLDPIFRERVSSFSLSFCAIRPLAIFGTRRKAALRGEGFTWVPDLRSFLKLREVGVLPTWV